MTTESHLFLELLLKILQEFLLHPLALSRRIQTSFTRTLHDAEYLLS